MLVDPDAPTPEDPKFAFWRHWVISGLQPGRGGGAAATALTEFLGPGPKPEYVQTQSCSKMFSFGIADC